MKGLVLFLFLFLPTPAYASDAQYCRIYSRGALTMAVGQLTPKERKEMTIPKLQEVLSRLRLTCGNLEEDAIETDTIWLVDLLDQIKRDPAAVSPPAAGAPQPPKRAPAAGSPIRAAPPPAKKDPAAICAAAHLKVVYKANGKSWRCK